MYLYVSLGCSFINIIKGLKLFYCLESGKWKTGCLFSFFLNNITELQKSFCKTAAVWCSLADSLCSGGMAPDSCHYLLNNFFLGLVIAEYSLLS